MTTITTSRKQAEFDSLVQLHLEGGSIGKLCRNGGDVFYAFVGNLYFEAPTRQAIAHKLATHSLG